jgi:uncharacterized protein (DUF433 family)
LPIISEYIAVTPGYCGGKPHIAGHRIKVQHIAVWHERMGMTPEEIVATYPALSLLAVHAALAYYHAHRAEIDTDIRQAGGSFRRFHRVCYGVLARRQDLGDRQQ